MMYYVYDNETLMGFGSSYELAADLVLCLRLMGGSPELRTSRAAENLTQRLQDHRCASCDSVSECASVFAGQMPDHCPYWS